MHDLFFSTWYSHDEKNFKFQLRIKVKKVRHRLYSSRAGNKMIWKIYLPKEVKHNKWRLMKDATCLWKLSEHGEEKEII